MRLGLGFRVDGILIAGLSLGLDLSLDIEKGVGIDPDGVINMFFQRHLRAFILQSRNSIK